MRKNIMNRVIKISKTWLKILCPLCELDWLIEIVIGGLFVILIFAVLLDGFYTTQIFPSYQNQFFLIHISSFCTETSLSNYFYSLLRKLAMTYKRSSLRLRLMVLKVILMLSSMVSRSIVNQLVRTPSKSLKIEPYSMMILS